MRIKNKSGQSSTIATVVKLVIIIVVFAVLIFTFTRLFGRASGATLDLFDKKYQDFDFYDGSYYHPDLPMDMLNFWTKGYADMIEEAKKVDHPCLGSFYIDDGANMRDSTIRFLQTETGIRMMLEDSKGVAGAINDEIFKNTDDETWKLCVMDPSVVNFDQFMNELEISLKNGGWLQVASSSHKTYLREIYDLRIDFNGKPKGGDIKAEYFITKTLEEQNRPPDIIPYHAYLAGDERVFGFDQARVDMIDRYHFMFVMSQSPASETNYFCIVPSEREGKGNAFETDDFKKLLYRIAKDSEPQDIDSAKALCPVPGGNDVTLRGVDNEAGYEKTFSVFNGYLSCYYYGCFDINEINKDICHDVFSRCDGLCHRYYGEGSGPKCLSCDGVDKCKDYMSPHKVFGIKVGSYVEASAENCNADLCQLGCVFDNEKGCIKE